MHVNMSEISAVLENAEKVFKTTFWKTMEGYEFVHNQRGRGRIISVAGTLVHVAYGNDVRTYSAPLLHQYVTELNEIPDDGAASTAVLFGRDVAELSVRWAFLQIDWRGLGPHAETIKKLLHDWESARSFSDENINRARSIGVGHIVPLAYEAADAQEPWNFIKASSAWRKLNEPKESIRCIREGLSPLLKSQSKRSDFNAAGLTCLLAALLDDDQLKAAEKFAVKLAKMTPDLHMARALFRYYREVGDEALCEVWLDKVYDCGGGPPAEGKPRRRPDWTAKWQRAEGPL